MISTITNSNKTILAILSMTLNNQLRKAFRPGHTDLTPLITNLFRFLRMIHLSRIEAVTSTLTKIQIKTNSSVKAEQV